MNRQGFVITVLALLIVVLQGCHGEPEKKGPQFGAKPSSPGVPIYHFVVHPLHNPAKLLHAYQPLMDYVNRRLLGARLVLEASRDYAQFEKKYNARKPEFLLPNPWQTLQAIKVNYHVFAMAGEPRDFKGIFVVRLDSHLKHIADLKGQSVSYPSHTALAACIMPQYFLYQHGINVNTDIKNHYVGSQESAIMNAYLKQTGVGVTWPPPWRAFQKEHPREAAELKVIWETESLVNNSVMARDDVPPQVTEQIRIILLELSGTKEGLGVLGAMETARFLPASDRDYDVVRQYIANFEREVRLVEQRR